MEETGELCLSNVLVAQSLGRYWLYYLSVACRAPSLGVNDAEGLIHPGAPSVMLSVEEVVVQGWGFQIAFRVSRKCWR